MLAGGLSRRLGRDKAWEVIGGMPLLQRVVDIVAGVVGETLVVSTPGVAERPLRSRLGLRRLEDLSPGKGSLGGIYTGLCHASSSQCLVVACDMPFLNPRLLLHLLELAPGYDVVIPVVAGHLEPLHAVYSKGCLGPIRALLERGNLKVIDFLPQVRVRVVAGAEIDRFDPWHLSFFNVNTEEDLEWARSRASPALVTLEELP